MGFGTGMAVWMRRADTKDFESVLKASVLNSSDQVLGLLCAYNSWVELTRVPLLRGPPHRSRLTRKVDHPKESYSDCLRVSNTP